MLESISHFFKETELEYVEQFLAALLPMALTVAIHAEGMGLATRQFRRFGSSQTGRARRVSNTMALITVVAIMLAAHFIEVITWAIFYVVTGMVADYQAAMVFSINSYTTLGASNIQLHGRWQGFDGFEAMVAMLMFGWSTAVLAVMVQKFSNAEI